MSSVLTVALVASGAFSLALGLVHIAIPFIARFRTAIGSEAAYGPVGLLVASPVGYSLRRQDLIGLTWVMSNAASYVLISGGVADLALALGYPVVPVVPIAWWLAGWWGIRAGSQFFIGRRWGDLLVAGVFAALSAIHVGAALSG